MLKKRGFSGAWAGSFDGILHRDISAVNLRLASDCSAYRGFLVPFGSLNPLLPDWQEDLRRIHEVHRMPGIRLHPNYHGYALKDPVAVEVLAAAAKRKLAVQIVVAMEDDRTQHRLVRVPPVDPAPLEKVLTSMPGLKVMILNGGNRTPVLRNAYLDFAMREGPYAVTSLLSSVGAHHVVLGSHAPLFYIESAVLKLKEAGLTEQQTRDIGEANSRSFLAS
jgi:hypothetical protein